MLARRKSIFRGSIFEHGDGKRARNPLRGAKLDPF
jgi:hypothetical protein